MLELNKLYHNAGFEFIGFDLDADYHAAANERLEAERAQLRMAF